MTNLDMILSIVFGFVMLDIVIFSCKALLMAESFSFIVVNLLRYFNPVRSEDTTRR